MTTASAPADCRHRLDLLTERAQHLWRTEPGATGPERRRILLELHGVRTDLESLAIRLDHRAPEPDDERLLHDCAARVARLAPHWGGGV